MARATLTLGERQQRGPAHFRQRDLAAALKALKAAGTPVERIEIGADGITIIPSQGDAAQPAQRNPWDEDK